MMIWYLEGITQVMLRNLQNFAPALVMESGGESFGMYVKEFEFEPLNVRLIYAWCDEKQHSNLNDIYFR